MNETNAQRVLGPTPPAAGGPPPASVDGVACAVCGRAFRPGGRRRYCSAACRQAAWRRRHAARRPPLPALRPRPPRAIVVYECPGCAARYLGEQRCPDCHLFCRRVGPGGLCPHCDEPVAVADLLADGGR
jgi:hypothetical protein